MKITNRLLVAVGNSQSTSDAAAFFSVFFFLFTLKATGLASKVDDIYFPVVFIFSAFAWFLFSSGVLDLLGVAYVADHVRKDGITGSEAQRFFGGVIKSLSGFILLAGGGAFLWML